MPQPLEVGATYTLSVAAPSAPEDRRLTTYLPDHRIIASDLAMQVVYPAGFNRATLDQLDYQLRSETAGWLRGDGQRIFYIIALPFMLVLAARSLAPLLGASWGSLGAIVLLVVLVWGLWAAPANVVADIPTHTLEAKHGPLLTLDESPGTYADLLLLSGSAQARKQPADDPAKRVSVIQPYEFTIGEETRPILSMQPPSAISYTLMLPARASLRTSLALNPQIWQPDKGDGVEFVVLLHAADGQHELLRRYIDPKHAPADRRWNDVALDLSAYAGQTVELTLQTLPGPAGNGTYDWAGWGAPVIGR